MDRSALPTDADTSAAPSSVQKQVGQCSHLPDDRPPSYDNDSDSSSSLTGSHPTMTPTTPTAVVAEEKGDRRNLDHDDKSKGSSSTSGDHVVESHPYKGLSYGFFTVQFMAVTLDLFMDTSVEPAWHYSITSIELVLSTLLCISPPRRCPPIGTGRIGSSNTGRGGPFLIPRTLSPWSLDVARLSMRGRAGDDLSSLDSPESRAFRELAERQASSMSSSGSPGGDCTTGGDVVHGAGAGAGGEMKARAKYQRIEDWDAERRAESPQGGEVLARLKQEKAMWAAAFRERFT